MRWAEIVVKCPAESAEAVTAQLMEIGCKGVSEQGIAARTLIGFLPESDNPALAVETLIANTSRFAEFGLSPVGEIAWSFAAEEDWSNAWRKYFVPVEIGDRLVIKPTWEEYAGDPNRVVVEIDPGQAFGTGGHQTTRLCLKALERTIRTGMIVADIGTGSGILAIAAAKLGASIVHATDIDSLPREVARENAVLNGLSGRVIVHEMDAFDEEAQNCDLVVANIIADIIIELTQSMFARLKPGGTLIASGIIDDRLQEVLTAFAEVGLVNPQIDEDEIWRAVTVQRTS